MYIKPQIIKHRWSVAGDDVLIVWDLEGFGDKQRNKIIDGAPKCQQCSNII